MSAAWRKIISALRDEFLKSDYLTFSHLILLSAAIIWLKVAFTMPATMMSSQTSKPMPYTANPLVLAANDLLLFLQITFIRPIAAGVPSCVIPLWPAKAGSLDELALTVPNLWAIFLHVILIITQTCFLISLLPLSVVGLPVLYLLYVVGFVSVNKWFSRLINGPRQLELFHSHPDCVKGKPKHEDEEWVFINGVSVGDHWLQGNLDLIAMTFRRPVVGIHNQTRGIIFDVLECIIQRDLGYATMDIRIAYDALLEILNKDHINKVVLILHSQGGIEGGLVLDWLYDTVDAEKLRKLEVYTFGNAANHWNAPVVSSKVLNGESPGSTTSSGGMNQNGAISQRVVRHIEHYANEGDYVSKFGVLHFRPEQRRSQSFGSGGNAPASIPAAATDAAKLVKNKAATYPLPATLKTALPRALTWAPSPRWSRDGFRDAQENNMFVGRLFKRASYGHMLNQHYLDNMFEMQGIDPEDRSKGEVKQSNDFMDQEVDLGVYTRWDTVQVVGEVRPPDSPTNVRNRTKKQIKDLSRLWEYRNGQSPRD